MKFEEICWPVYSLGSINPQEENGVLFIRYIEEDKLVTKIIDDKSIEGGSLAKRRLILSFNPSIHLFKIKYSLFFLGDLIKMSKTSRWFIDSSGELFKYKKSRMAPLICKKITRVMKGLGNSFIEVEGRVQRFPILFHPKPEEKYAGLLKINNGYQLYGIYKEPFDNTVRKI